MQNYCFNTDSFRDARDKVEENPNEIEGYNLTTALKGALEAEHFICEEVFAEDFGWAFYAFRDEQKYFITASVDPEDDQVDFGFFANINVDKTRSFWDRLRGRNKMLDDDPAGQIVHRALKSFGDVHNLEYHPAS
ncbi:hypothetical protein [Halocynthiibacter styelae]|uniref:Uncharacterized protein n=1 Tax=Halocynthiibacter styelae TaxID=2761955 RepID=A0A8J7ICR3_9RHOB|nr:hypothetical protein [Paenihalocynthiibacter styelae]MBI1493648.1 hypothetical protein [Paenihalocynthiibacter styelae]